MEITTQKQLRMEYESGAIMFYLQTKWDKLSCSNCGSSHMIKRYSKIRVFRTAPIGLKPVLIRAMIQRLTCQDCGLTRQEKIAFADKKSYTPVAAAYYLKEELKLL